MKLFPSFLVIIFSFSITLTSETVAESPSSVDKKLTAAQELKEASKNKDWPEVIKITTRSIEASPEVSKWYFIRAIAYQRIGNHESLMADLQTVLPITPGSKYVTWIGKISRMFLFGGDFMAARNVNLFALQSNRVSPTIIGNLGHSYLLMGDEKKAEEKYKEVLLMIEDRKKLGSSVIVYFDQFIKWGWSVEQSRRWKRWFDDSFNDLEKAKLVKNNLIAHFQKGEIEEAVVLARQVLSIKEKVLGAEHRETATSLNNLAILLEQQGQVEEAEQYYRRSLQIKERSLGLGHEETQTLVSNLADLLEKRGAQNDAVQLYRQTITTLKKDQVGNYSQIISSQNSLARLLVKMGQYAEAEILYRQILSSLEKSLGTEHPVTANNMSLLADLLIIEGGRSIEAKQLYQRSLTIFEKTLGPDHDAVKITEGKLNSL